MEKRTLLADVPPTETHGAFVEIQARGLTVDEADAFVFVFDTTPMTPGAGEIHGWDFLERVTGQQPSTGTSGSAHMALSARGMAGGTMVPVCLGEAR